MRCALGVLGPTGVVGRPGSIGSRTAPAAGQHQAAPAAPAAEQHQQQDCPRRREGVGMYLHCINYIQHV